MTDEERERAIREFEARAAAGELDLKAIDALLGSACSRLLQSGAVVNAMRNALRCGRPFEYAALALSLIDHLGIARHCMDQVGSEWHRANGAASQTSPGGLIH